MCIFSGVVDDPGADVPGRPIPPGKLTPAPKDGERSATHEIGAIESTGKHKGEIYGGIYPADNKPIWFSVAPKAMDHYEAAAWARRQTGLLAWALGQGGSLPTWEQGQYLTTLKGKGGAITEIFNLSSAQASGCIWSSEITSSYDSKDAAWCLRLRDGAGNLVSRHTELPVLSVFR